MTCVCPSVGPGKVHPDCPDHGTAPEPVESNRRKCPHCGKRVTRSIRGYLRSHLDKRTKHKCRGSGLLTR